MPARPRLWLTCGEPAGIGPDLLLALAVDGDPDLDLTVVADPALLHACIVSSFDVAERGFLREGYFADLALIDDTPFTVRREDVLSKCAWSPFEGTTFHSRIASTWVNGQLAWDGSKLIGEPIGSRLAFAR